MAGHPFPQGGRGLSFHTDSLVPSRRWGGSCLSDSSGASIGSIRQLAVPQALPGVPGGASRLLLGPTVCVPGAVYGAPAEGQMLASRGLSPRLSHASCSITLHSSCLSGCGLLYATRRQPDSREGLPRKGSCGCPPCVHTLVGLTIGVPSALVLAFRPWGDTGAGRCPVSCGAPTPRQREWQLVV